MNNFLHENLLTIVFFLLLIILLFIGIIGLVLVKLLLAPKEENSGVSLATKATKDAISIAPPIDKSTRFKQVIEEKVVEKFYCQNHAEASSAGSCLICEDVFCVKCLTEHDGLYFCKEHFKIFANNKWKQITDVKTTPNTPDDGLYIYHFKRHIWREYEIPSFVLTHYKINIEEDFIESFIQLNVIEKEAERLRDKIEKYRAHL